MESIQALRERRAHHLKETRNLLDNNPGAKWGPDQQKTYDDHLKVIDATEAEIARVERQLQAEAERSFPGARAELGRISAGSYAMSKHVQSALEAMGRDAKAAAPSFAVYDKWLRGGDQAMAQEDWKILNTMSTTTGSQGGNAVQTDIAAVIIDALKDYSGIMDVAEIIRTEKGNPMSYPGSDGTAEVGELIAENNTATGADPSFTTVSLNTFKYSSKIIACPIELLQDAQVDMEAFLRNRLRQRLGRILNQHFTTGTAGGTQPNGLVTGSTVGVTGATGQTSTVIYDNLVDLIDAVDIAYHGPNCRFMFGQAMRKVIRKIKDGQGRPIWMPSYDAGIAGGFVDELLGYKVKINNDMASPGASNKTIAFGDFSYYKVRLAMEVTLFRFTDSAYTKLGQVGFLAWARAGGNLVDTAATRLYQHSAS